ncbi:MAG: NUDIX hydrolase [bacterium]|nr:NUDIX hydrolase [bacterium]
MHRRDILDKLANFIPRDPRDSNCRDQFIEFIKTNPNCFERSLEIGHITGSAWIVNPARDRFLLTFHKKLELWLQLGGHADGNPSVLEVALGEAREESGIYRVEPLSDQIYDLDIHRIPGHKGVPEHFHYDVRFICEADDTVPLIISDESHDLRWLTAAEVLERTSEESILRMLRKTPKRIK